MLKLPKNVLNNPLAPAVEKLFAGTEKRLMFGGRVMVSRWPFTKKLQAALGDAIVGRELVQSLEVISKTWTKSLKACWPCKAKTEQAPTERLSRLLLVSNDGSDRFYHDVDSMLAKHGQRTWCCVVEASGDELGQAIKPGGNPAKAVMIADRKALEYFLLNLV